MKNKDFEQLKNQDHFLMRTTAICENCYLKLNVGLASGGSDNFKPITKAQRDMLALRSRSRQMSKAVKLFH